MVVLNRLLDSCYWFPDMECLCLITAIYYFRGEHGILDCNEDEDFYGQVEYTNYQCQQVVTRLSTTHRFRIGTKRDRLILLTMDVLAVMLPFHWLRSCSPVGYGCVKYATRMPNLGPRLVKW